MKKIILSAGPFGGIEIEIPIDQNLIEMLNDDGFTYIYECRPDLKGQALLIEIK